MILLSSGFGRFFIEKAGQIAGLFFTGSSEFFRFRSWLRLFPFGQLPIL